MVAMVVVEIIMALLLCAAIALLVVQRRHMMRAKGTLDSLGEGLARVERSLRDEISDVRGDMAGSVHGVQESLQRDIASLGGSLGDEVKALGSTLGTMEQSLVSELDRVRESVREDVKGVGDSLGARMERMEHGVRDELERSREDNARFNEHLLEQLRISMKGSSESMTRALDGIAGALQVFQEGQTKRRRLATLTGASVMVAAAALVVLVVLAAISVFKPASAQEHAASNATTRLSASSIPDEADPVALVAAMPERSETPRRFDESAPDEHVTPTPRTRQTTSEAHRAAEPTAPTPMARRSFSDEPRDALHAEPLSEASRRPGDGLVVSLTVRQSEEPTIEPAPVEPPQAIEAEPPPPPPEPEPEPKPQPGPQPMAGSRSEPVAPAPPVAGETRPPARTGPIEPAPLILEPAAPNPQESRPIGNPAHESVPAEKPDTPDSQPDALDAPWPLGFVAWIDPSKTAPAGLEPAEAPPTTPAPPPDTPARIEPPRGRMNKADLMEQVQTAAWTWGGFADGGDDTEPWTLDECARQLEILGRLTRGEVSDEVEQRLMSTAQSRIGDAVARSLEARLTTIQRELDIQRSKIGHASFNQRVVGLRVAQLEDDLAGVESMLDKFLAGVPPDTTARWTRDFFDIRRKHEQVTKLAASVSSQVQIVKADAGR